MEKSWIDNLIDRKINKEDLLNVKEEKIMRTNNTQF